MRASTDDKQPLGEAYNSWSREGYGHRNQDVEKFQDQESWIWMLKSLKVMVIGLLP